MQEKHIAPQHWRHMVAGFRNQTEISPSSSEQNLNHYFLNQQQFFWWNIAEHYKVYC